VGNEALDGFYVRIDRILLAQRKTKKLIDNFEVVISSRWPTSKIFVLHAGVGALLKTLSAWPLRGGIYAFPKELRWASNSSLCGSQTGKPFSPSWSGRWQAYTYILPLAGERLSAGATPMITKPNPMLVSRETRS